eukprot:365416-Chlamydomonas_euryale.AAC.2
MARNAVKVRNRPREGSAARKGAVAKHTLPLLWERGRALLQSTCRPCFGLQPARITASASAS